MKKILVILVASVAMMAMTNTVSAQKTYHFWADVFSLEAGTPSSMPNGGMIVLNMQYNNPSDSYPGKTGQDMLNACMEYLQGEGAPVRLQYFRVDYVDSDGTVHGTAVLQLFPAISGNLGTIQFRNGTVRNY